MHRARSGGHIPHTGDFQKVLKLQKIYLDEIDKYSDVEGRDKDISWEKIHMSSCARVGYILAAKRGLDCDLAAIACAIHDYGRVITGVQKGHAEAGYGPVQEFLRKTEMFSEDEIIKIAVAVKNHSKKGEIGGPLEEIVKDADCLDFDMYGYELPRQEQKDRLKRLKDEKAL